MGEPLIAVRALHVAATMMVAGGAIFSVLIADPVWRGARAPFAGWIAPFHKWAGYWLWLGLVIAVASGMARLVLVAADITSESWTGVLRDGMAWTVFTQTQFGVVSQIRLMLASSLAVVLLLPAGRECRANWLRVLSAVVAVLLLGSLAWTGHAAGAAGSGAGLHLVSDILHLLAAGAWIGGLVPLALLMAQLGKRPDREAMAACNLVLRRFSNLGVASVAAILMTGLINTWYLTDHLRGLTGTAYGQLVQIKIGLFIALILLAADSRLRLLPRFSHGEDREKSRTLAKLRRNIVLEIALGMAVIYVVGVLGVTPPAGHIHAARIDQVAVR